MKCPKCNDTGYFEQTHFLTGDKIHHIPCLCPIKVSKEQAIECEKLGLKLGEAYILE